MPATGIGGSNVGVSERAAMLARALWEAGDFIAAELDRGGHDVFGKVKQGWLK